MINFTNFQNIEYFTSEKDQYLLIHKCACTSVRRAQNNYFKNVECLSFPDFNKVRWTVLRDPYDRFISGIAYDLNINNTNNIQDTLCSMIEKNNFFENIYEFINIKNRTTGKLSHIIPQSTYLFQQPLDFYVDIKDLDLFLSINYNTDNIKDNIGNKETYSLVEEVIENYKQKIIDIYSMDYYVIERIKANNLFWRWNNGKVIDE